MSNETKRYLAMRESGHETIYATSFDQFLARLGHWTASSGGFYIYDSWIALDQPLWNQDLGLKELRAESLAAGRTIELIDGKYVARGVEEKREPKSPGQVAWDWIEAARQRVQEKRAADVSYEPKREALTWNKPVTVDRFPGFSVASDTQDQTESRNSFQLSPDLSKATHQIPAKCGSAYLLKSA